MLLLRVNLPYDLVCPSGGRLVGRSVGWMVGLSKSPNRAGSFTSMLLSEQPLDGRSPIEMLHAESLQQPVGHVTLAAWSASSMSFGIVVFVIYDDNNTRKVKKEIGL